MRSGWAARGREGRGGDLQRWDVFLGKGNVPLAVEDHRDLAGLKTIRRRQVLPEAPHEGLHRAGAVLLVEACLPRQRLDVGRVRAVLVLPANQSPPKSQAYTSSWGGES